MMSTFYKYILFWGIGILFASCDAINPAEEIPAFIQIDEVDFTTALESQGSADEAIKDVWVYANGNLLGAFNLPATIPVLQTGTTEVVIDFGIRENGINSQPIIYPYYNRYTTTVDLVEDEIVTIQPSTSYKDDVEFVILEDFEGPHTFGDDRDSNEETAIVRSPIDAIEGNAGRIVLTSDNPVIEVASNTAYSNLPQTGSNPVYLEISYKNELPLGIGLIGYNDQAQEKVFYSHGINPSGDWKKVYINFTEVLFNSQLTTYQVSFLASLPDGSTEAVILVDNIKMLHFK